MVDLVGIEPAPLQLGSGVHSFLDTFNSICYVPSILRIFPAHFVTAWGLVVCGKITGTFGLFSARTVGFTFAKV
jgi:hypothetical protein